MEWVVTLSGSAHTLEELSKVFNSPDLCIQKDHNVFVLKSRDFADLGSYDQVRDHTTEILTSLNGAAKLSLGSGSPIKIGSISEIRDDGTRHTYVSAAVVGASATITCSVVVIHADGTIEESHPADPANYLDGSIEERRTRKKGLTFNRE